ncbi:MAG: hypothetical protein ABMB14_13355, partial [Myxococcota bacterium]
MVLVQLALGTAAAQPAGPELPVPLVVRSPTLPQASVAIDVDSTLGLNGDAPAALDLAAGLGVGVTDQLELGVQVLPLELAPDVRYGAPSVYLKYGAWLGDITTLTPGIRVFVPVSDLDVAMLDAGIELGLRSGRQLLVNVTPIVNLTFAGSDVEPAFAVPVGLVIQPDRRVFVTVDTGLSTDPVDPRFRAPRPGADRGVYVPLGASIGTTFGRPRSAVSDLSIGVYWPE